MDTFFVADLHFGHAKIIEYSHRPFSDDNEQTAILTANWNAVVGPQDDVWVIGDFCMKNPGRYLRHLNGHVHLIKGNHDRYADNPDKTGFASIRDVKMLKLHGQEIWLSHYAHRVWPKMHYGAWHLFGHSHGGLADFQNKSLDVGVDNRKKFFADKDPKKLYAPWTLDEITFVMSTHKTKVVDHHGKKETN